MTQEVAITTTVTKQAKIYVADPRLGIGIDTTDKWSTGPVFQNADWDTDCDAAEELYDEIYQYPANESVEDFIIRLYEVTKDLENPIIDWSGNNEDCLAIKYNRELTEAEKEAAKKKAETTAKRKASVEARKAKAAEKKKAEEIKLLKDLIDKHGLEAVQ